MLQELRTQVPDSQATVAHRPKTPYGPYSHQYGGDGRPRQGRGVTFEELEAKHGTDAAQERKHTASLHRDKSDRNGFGLDEGRDDGTARPFTSEPLTHLQGPATASEGQSSAEPNEDDVFGNGSTSTHTR